MGAEVRLNVYDLLEANKHIAWAGLGVFHSGVEVHGREYAYGGHEFSTSGVFETPPRMVPGGARYRESIALGPTALSGQEVEDLVKRLSREYLGDRYHLLYRNCNHFTSELAERLTGSASPGWVNRLAALARLLNTVTPCILPPSIRTLARPPALKGDAQPLLPPGVPRISDSEARRPLHPTAALGGAAHVPRAPPGS